jgi:hypothetical protein
MGLPRTFVGFSSTDIHNYRLMQAWKQNQRIDFNKNLGSGLTIDLFHDIHVDSPDGTQAKG